MVAKAGGVAEVESAPLCRTGLPARPLALEIEVATPSVPQAAAGSPSPDHWTARRSVVGRFSTFATAWWHSTTRGTDPDVASSLAGKEALREWILWPVTEATVLVLCVLPPMFIYGRSLAGETSLIVINRAVTACIAAVAGWGHMLYLALRIFLKVSPRLNCILLSVLVVWQVLLFLRSFCGEDNKCPGGVDKDVWNTVLLFINLCIFVTYSLRFYSTFIAFKEFSRKLVSKKKRRFVDTRLGIDLDLSYITRHVIAMGFPTDKVFEQQYRNPMAQVQLLFKSRHAGHYKVYNLCSERTYTPSSFENAYQEVRFPDHNPCPLAQLSMICNDMEEFCRGDRVRNVVAVHCKAGKGRTGLVISAFLLHSRRAGTAEEALAWFAQKRTHDGKGVTIPSQIRWVHHYETVVKDGGMRPPRWLRLAWVAVFPRVPDVWHFQVMTHEDGVVFDPRHHSRAPPLEGDLKVVFFLGKQKLFHLWLHTAYDTGQQRRQQPGGNEATLIWACPHRDPSRNEVSAVFPHDQLDGPHKKKFQSKHGGKFSGAFEVQLSFTEVGPEELSEWKEHANRRKTDIEHKDVEDYDDLEHDTDDEEVMTIVTRGYMLRTMGMCRGRQKRLCELHTTGHLHINGTNTLNTLVVNVAEDADCFHRELVNGKEEARLRWRVRNPRTQCWELLEAENMEERDRWDQGFMDALRLGRALKAIAGGQDGELPSESVSTVPSRFPYRADTRPIFCKFFWKLNHDADAESVPRGFELEQWRVRLFVLDDDGNMWVYSHKHQREVVFCNFAAFASDAVEKLPFSWRGMPHVVLFQVATGKGKSKRTLAALSEDYESLLAKLAKYHEIWGSSRSFPGAEEGGLGV